MARKSEQVVQLDQENGQLKACIIEVLCNHMNTLCTLHAKPFYSEKFKTEHGDFPEQIFKDMIKFPF